MPRGRGRPRTRGREGIKRKIEKQSGGGSCDEEGSKDKCVIKGKVADENEVPPEKKEDLDVKRQKLAEAKPQEGSVETPLAEVDTENNELAGKVHVYMNADGRCYDAMLNQTNIGYNNNKFYKLQVLEGNGSGAYWVWFRWGRVGARGQSSLTPCGTDLDRALNTFHKKFREKTYNEFLADMDSFQKVPGKYDLIRIDYTRKIAEEKPNEEQGEALKEATSTMDERIRNLMTTLCDVKEMEREARKLEYDFHRVPLGKITKEQIRRGYESLSRIEKYIQGKKFGKDFNEAVSEYYTRIPHAFGMRTPPLIKTLDELKHEIELLELLTGIEITISKIAGDPLERHYNRLRWALQPVEKEDDKYKIIEEYLANTHGHTHDRRLRLCSVFELSCKGESGKHFRNDLANHKLLWHGSRMANWYSILAQGLRIAPPEAPVTGYMFGKGVYFADMSTKSANYSFVDSSSRGYMLLSQVALGEVLDLHSSDSEMHHKLPKGKNSVRGVGRFAPDGHKMIDGNVEVPCGKPCRAAQAGEPSLIYNEFIVYNLEQIRERFLVEVEDVKDFEL